MNETTITDTGGSVWLEKNKYIFVTCLVAILAIHKTTDIVL